VIYIFTDRYYDYVDDKEISFGDIDKFFNWAKNETIFQLDTETLVVEDGPDAIDERKLVLVQIGDKEGENQWLFEFEHIIFDKDTYNVLKLILSDVNKSFIAHNARFEYIVIKRWLNITIENLHDTFLMSKILNTGLDLENGYHSLAGCLHRFFGIEMDKSAQTTFTFGPLTRDQVIYAADDVVMMKDLFDKFKELLESWDLWFLYDRVERQVLKVYGDMMMSPMKFDSDHWLNLAESLKQEDTTKEKELNELVLSDDKLVNYLENSSKVLGLPLIQPKDILDLNWGSNVVRKNVLSMLIPELKDIQRFTKPELKKISKSGILSSKLRKILDKYLDREYGVLNKYLRIYHKQWLLDHRYFIPKGEVRINWASNLHRLYIFQFYYPNMKDTNAKTLARIYTNKLINKYKEYVKIHKYVTTYGVKFIDKYVRKDGMIAPTKFVQILDTGRIAAGVLLQLPGQARFRNAFLPPEDDWIFIDSDYNSQELAIMAYIAKEEQLLDVIRTGKDAHMFVTQKLFPKEWEEAAEQDCIQLTTGKRCSCKEHNKMRTKGKTFNFGIPFGMTYIGLADRLDINRREAKEMLDIYYDKFKALKIFFDEAERFGMNNKYIVGIPPTKRIRFFHEPLHNGELQAIGREAKNFRIQEAAASMVKIALIKLRKYIIDNNFPARLCLPIHDEILSTCLRDRSEEWKQVQERAMTEAADLFIEKGLLGVETKILDRWTK